LKRDRRRLDELVTIKEGQVERIIEEARGYKEDRDRCRKEGDRWKDEVNRLQSELNAM
jgi:hypothetical protein